MEKALKGQIVPFLRGMGFRGSYPNLYRQIGDRIDLLQIQFHRVGGACRLELAWSNGARDNIYINKNLPPQKLRVTQANAGASGRKILGAADSDSDRWFHFGEASTGELRGELTAPDRICEQLMNLIAGEANEWWKSR